MCLGARRDARSVALDEPHAGVEEELGLNIVEQHQEEASMSWNNGVVKTLLARARAMYLGALVIASVAGTGCGGDGSPTASTCLSGGNSDAIINALARAGVAELCQGAAFSADKPIHLSDGQQIFTVGYPASTSAQALIQVAAGATFNEPMIQTYTARHVEIRNVHLDGNRGTNPYTYSQALIAVAGDSDVLDGVTATNTAGLSAIAAADNPNCDGLRITNNHIADNGFHTGSGTPWANGIDVRCSDAYVAYNEVRNATDGGISFYGGRNTVIEQNLVVNSERSAYSGIIAADLFAGDFTGSIVRNNTIETCCSQHVHIALAIGTHPWCDDANPAGDCQFATGVTFEDNNGTGTYGLGVVVDGMYNATVQRNNLAMTQWPSQACQVTNENAYVVNLAHASGTFDPGYANRQVHWPCLGPINQ